MNEKSKTHYEPVYAFMNMAYRYQRPRLVNASKAQVAQGRCTLVLRVDGLRGPRVMQPDSWSRMETWTLPRKRQNDSIKARGFWTYVMESKSKKGKPVAKKLLLTNVQPLTNGE